jgi:hypothetical protein
MQAGESNSNSPDQEEQHSNSLPEMDGAHYQLQFQ